jgi:hypothetical protein
MEIVINVVRSANGRMAGTLRTPGFGAVRRVRRTMELLAALERVCAVDDRPEAPDQC